MIYYYFSSCKIIEILVDIEFCALGEGFDSLVTDVALALDRVKLVNGRHPLEQS